MEFVELVARCAVASKQSYLFICFQEGKDLPAARQ
jgi:hypothetical protein